MSLTFPYCNFTYGSNFPNLSFAAKSFPSTTVMLSFLPVLVWRFDEPLSDCWEATRTLFMLCEPSEYCHSFTIILTFNYKTKWKVVIWIKYPRSLSLIYIFTKDKPIIIFWKENVISRHISQKRTEVHYKSMLSQESITLQIPKT